MVSGVIVKLVNRLNIDQEVSTRYIYTDWQKLFYLGWPALTIIDFKVFSSPISLANRPL